MKILLTGGAGYVGSACLRHLAKQGHEVVAYDNLVEGHPKAVGGSPLVVGDILDTKLLAQTLKDPLLLEVALGKREKFVIFGDDYPTPDGTCVRDYVHIEDLANAHRLAIEATTKGTKGVFNIGIGNGQTVLEVIKACERVTGKSLATEMGTRRAGDPVALVSDPAKLRRVLGWEPQYKTIDSIVETAWAWHQANPDGYTGPRFPDA